MLLIIIILRPPRAHSAESPVGLSLARRRAAPRGNQSLCGRELLKTSRPRQLCHSAGGHLLPVLLLLLLSRFQRRPALAEPSPKNSESIIDSGQLRRRTPLASFSNEQPQVQAPTQVATRTRTRTRTRARRAKTNGDTCCLSAQMDSNSGAPRESPQAATGVHFE